MGGPNVLAISTVLVAWNDELLPSWAGRRSRARVSEGLNRIGRPLRLESVFVRQKASPCGFSAFGKL